MISPTATTNLAVVLDEIRDVISLTEKLRRLKPKGLPLDLLVVQADELSDPLISGMFSGCKVLYDGLRVQLPNFEKVHKRGG